MARYREDPDGFRREWVEFDMCGDEASRNVWDLLYDYCHLYGYSHLSDPREPAARILESYLGDEYTYPMGKVFMFNHWVRPHRWWWKYTQILREETEERIMLRLRQSRLSHVLINYDNVVHLPGVAPRRGVYLILYKDFQPRNLERLYSKNDVILFKVKATKCQQEGNRWPGRGGHGRPDEGKG